MAYSRFQLYTLCASCKHIGAKHKGKDGKCVWIKDWEPSCPEGSKKCVSNSPRKDHPHHDSGRGYLYDLDNPRVCKCVAFVVPRAIQEFEEAEK